MQALGRDADFEQKKEEPILDRGAPGAALGVVSRGRTRGWIEDRDRADGAESTREFHIFHERDLGETSEAVENFAPHKNRLVAEQRSAIPSKKTCHHFQSAQAWVAIVEGAVKGAADDAVLLQRLLQSAKMFGAEFGIGVLENQNVAAGGGGAEIHLRASARDGAAQETRMRQLRQPGRRRIIRGFDHDDLLQLLDAG